MYGSWYVVGMGNYSYKFYAPLANFSADILRIELTENIVIRKISPNEEREIKIFVEEYPEVAFSDFLLECVVAKQTRESRPGEYMRHGRTQIEKALTVMRLYGEGAIGYNLLVECPPRGDPFGRIPLPILHYRLWASKTSSLWGRPYRVESQEVSQVSRFFTEFNLPDLHRLRLAIDYFNKSYIEPYTPRDSLLDLVISLESLYLKSRESGEFGYRLRTRMACILATELKKRKRIFEDIKRAYDYRSKIVHGSRNPDISDEFFLRIRDYTRQSLRIFAKNPALRDSLDDAILKSAETARCPPA